ncbi:MAG TPA: glycosyltransferase family 4 protein [Candidatus Binatia bacterium]|nr:glycosyltransferase family 4 protein [Candidatus Binatia bacterium]
MKPLRVLITNLSLDGRTGTETFTRDQALALRALGYEPAIYSPRVGKLAEELRRAGIPASSELSELAAPDVIHGHHNIPIALAILRFPGTPAVFVCHDAKAPHDEAPAFAAIQQYVAVDFLCRDRLKADGIREERISVIGNAVDLDRFRPRTQPLPPMPKRALLFSNYANEGTHLPVVRETCARAGLQLDVCGYGVGNVCEKPEAVLGKYDIVFAKARCAMEAMVCGAAVILCGAEGAGELVRSDHFDALRDYNFGRHVLRQSLSAAYLLTQIRRYDAAEAQIVSELARAKLGLGSMMQQWVELYGRLRRVAQQADDREAVLRLLQNVDRRVFNLTDTENKFIGLKAAHEQQDRELAVLRKQVRKAVQFHGVLKHLWKFLPARAVMRLMGARELTR